MRETKDFLTERSYLLNNNNAHNEAIMTINAITEGNDSRNKTFLIIEV